MSQNEAKVGVYVCQCGINISSTVDVEEVRSFASRLKNVEVARQYQFMCSEPGQAMIKKDIQELGVNRVVVASCSPQMHEPTFRNACARAGLNPYLFEMSNIREQDSWVTTDKLEATKKAKALIAAAVGRVVHQQPLNSLFVPIDPAVLVVGGGITGVLISVMFAAAGVSVCVLEADRVGAGSTVARDPDLQTELGRNTPPFLPALKSLWRAPFSPRRARAGRER